MTDSTRHSRRTLIASGGLGLALLAAGRSGWAAAQDADPSPDRMGGLPDQEGLRELIKEQLARYSHVWRATSPATHLDDTFRLTITNARATEQSYLVVTTVMDHRAHYHAAVLAEEITLAPGASWDLEATNTYGAANHFQTTVMADTALVSDLGLLVVVEDAAAVETARFTEGAFLALTVEELRAPRDGATASERIARRRRRRRESRTDDHRHGDDATPSTSS